MEDILRELTFGVKWTKDADKIGIKRTKLPLRVLPKKQVTKRQKLEHDADEIGGIKLFSDSITTINVKEKPKPVKTSKDTKIAEIRQLNQIYVWGSNIPDPFIDFKDLKLSKQLMKNIKEAHFEEPTPIQMQSVPIMFNKRTLLANAPTGSGKTLAFILPILQTMQTRPIKGINAVIITPTNVLSQQIYVQFLKFSNEMPVIVEFLEPEIQINQVTTPQKFIYSMKNGNLTADALKSLRWLVLDEADRLFETTEGDRNFRLQFDEIYKVCKGPKTKLAFFSATFSFELETWCKEQLEDPVMLCIGNRNSANSAVNQELTYVGDERGKLFALEQMFNGSFEPPALVFVQSKDRAGTLFVELKRRCPKVPIGFISSELTTEARNKTLNGLRIGKVWVLVCTEMLGRGLDIPNVNLVVNFDLPNSIISYIHRVGRTGRAGLTGRAVTYFSQKDMKFIRPIATVIHQAGFEVPDFTLQLDKLTRKQRQWLLRHAPKRRKIGSTTRWNRVKKAGMKDRTIKRDPALLVKKRSKKKKSMQSD